MGTYENSYPETIKEDILESWRRCRAQRVPVDTFEHDNLVSPGEVQEYLADLEGSPYSNFSQVCKDLGITISVYDRQARLKQIFNHPSSYEEDWKKARGYFRDASEARIGTNSVALALYQGRPYQVLGSDHYKLIFRECSCTAAPIIDSHGEIAGAVNYSRTDLNQTKETIHLLYSLARIYENLENGRETYTNTGQNQRRDKERAPWTFDDILCADSKMHKLIELSQKIALTDTPVIIYGESGVGKELFASALHNHSRRRNERFVAINCGAIPVGLLESELFGYEKGSFTGANRDGKSGLIEHSTGGTLFLDEIESMTQEAQVRLLRVLSTSRVKRIGALNPVPVDLRIIAASKKNLFEEVIKGNFREDLYYRLNVIDLTIPPLRERSGDIALIATRYMEDFSTKYGIPVQPPAPEFLSALMFHDWPGNVRELKNIIERSVIFAVDGTADSRVIPNRRDTTVSPLPAGFFRLGEILKGNSGILKTIQDLVIQAILEQEKGNIARAADRLGVSRQTLYNKINKNI